MWSSTDVIKQAFDTPQPPLAILNFYGAIGFTSPFWSQPLASLPTHLREPRPQDEIDTLKGETRTFLGGVSLEGQNKQAGQGTSNPEARQKFAMHAISTGTVLPTIWPSHPQDLEKIDPVANVGKVSFTPCIHVFAF